MKKALFIRHLAFEDAGNLAEVLRRRDYRIEYIEAGAMDLKAIDPLEPDLLVSLGGHISANDEPVFPFLADERNILGKRMRADRPTLGICLGAQIMARELGSRVFRGTQKEIGWFPITLTEEGGKSPLEKLAINDYRVLHWHGETFDLPQNAKRLASTEICLNQAFSYGKRCLALQFHPEATLSNMERWFIGHIGEIESTPGLTVWQLRQDTAHYALGLEKAAAKVWGKWLDEVE